MKADVGAIGLLHEDDTIIRVKVLENNSDAERDALKVEVIEVVHPSRFRPTRGEPGDVWDIWQERIGGWLGMWRFEQEDVAVPCSQQST